MMLLGDVGNHDPQDWYKFIQHEWHYMLLIYTVVTGLNKKISVRKISINAPFVLIAAPTCIHYSSYFIQACDLITGLNKYPIRKA